MKFTPFLYTVLAILGVTISSYAQDIVELEWIADVGSDSSHETVFSTAVDAKGNIIAIARTWDSAQKRANDILKVKKTNTAGQLLWQKELTGAMIQGMLPGGLCVDSNDNVFFLLNTFNKSFYFDTVLFECPNWESTIFKLSGNGDLVWTKQINRLFYGWAMEDNTALLAIDRNNDLVLIGGSRSSDSTFKIDGVPYFKTPYYGRFFAAKFSNDGLVRWANLIDKQIDDSVYDNNSAGYYTAIDSNNNIIILGVFGGTFRNLETELLSEGSNDMFLAKIRPAGDLFWINRIGGNVPQRADWPWSVAVDRENNIYAQGYVYEDVTISRWSGVSTGSSKPEIFICKFDPLGHVIWNKRIEGLDHRRLGTTLDDCPMGLVYSTKDNSIICRSHLFSATTIDSMTLGTESEDGVPALWAYDTEGKLLWGKTISVTEGYVQFNDVDVDNDGNIFLGGYAGKRTFDRISQNVTIEDTSFVTYGEADAVLTKFSVKEFSSVALEAPFIHLLVYPNPFSERTTIGLPDDMPQSSVMQIFTVVGSKVLEFPLASNGSRFVFERQGLAAGMYHYKVVAGSAAIAKGEFVIQ